MPKTNVRAVSKSISKTNKKQQISKVVPYQELLKNLDKPMTRNQQTAYLSEVMNVSKKDAGLAINALFTMIGAHLKKIGLINLAGLMKIYLAKKSATKAREAISPLTGKLTLFKAKPARQIVRIRPLKKLKEIITSK